MVFFKQTNKLKEQIERNKKSTVALRKLIGQAQGTKQKLLALLLESINENIDRNDDTICSAWIQKMKARFPSEQHFLILTGNKSRSFYQADLREMPEYIFYNKKIKSQIKKEKNPVKSENNDSLKKESELGNTEETGKKKEKEKNPSNEKQKSDSAQKQNIKLKGELERKLEKANNEKIMALLKDLIQYIEENATLPVDHIISDWAFNKGIEKPFKAFRIYDIAEQSNYKKGFFDEVDTTVNNSSILGIINKYVDHRLVEELLLSERNLSENDDAQELGAVQSGKQENDPGASKDSAYISPSFH